MATKVAISTMKSAQWWSDSCFKQQLKHHADNKSAKRAKYIQETMDTTNQFHEHVYSLDEVVLGREELHDCNAFLSLALVLLNLRHVVRCVEIW